MWFKLHWQEAIMFRQIPTKQLLQDNTGDTIAVSRKSSFQCIFTQDEKNVCCFQILFHHHYEKPFCLGKPILPLKYWRQSSILSLLPFTALSLFQYYSFTFIYVIIDLMLSQPPNYKLHEARRCLFLLTYYSPWYAECNQNYVCSINII